MKRKLLPIGTYVKGIPCKSVYTKVNGISRKEVKVYENSEKKGIIVGCKFIAEGKYVKDGYKSYYDEPFHHFLKVENKVLVYKIVTGYLNKPTFIMIDSVRILPTPDIPLLDIGWDDKARKLASEESKNWERDEKGRWI